MNSQVYLNTNNATFKLGSYFTSGNSTPTCQDKSGWYNKSGQYWQSNILTANKWQLSRQSAGSGSLHKLCSSSSPPCRCCCISTSPASHQSSACARGNVNCARLSKILGNSQSILSVQPSTPPTWLVHHLHDNTTTWKPLLNDTQITASPSINQRKW